MQKTLQSQMQSMARNSFHKAWSIFGASLAFQVVFKKNRTVDCALTVNCDLRGEMLSTSLFYQQLFLGVKSIHIQFMRDCSLNLGYIGGKVRKKTNAFSQI